jgi:hypothetical protein
MGNVVGVSGGSAILQETLRRRLRHSLSGEGVEEVRFCNPRWTWNADAELIEI